MSANRHRQKLKWNASGLKIIIHCPSHQCVCERASTLQLHQHSDQHNLQKTCCATNQNDDGGGDDYDDDDDDDDNDASDDDDFVPQVPGEGERGRGSAEGLHTLRATFCRCVLQSGFTLRWTGETETTETSYSLTHCMSNMLTWLVTEKIELQLYRQIDDVCAGHSKTWLKESAVHSAVSCDLGQVHAPLVNPVFPSSTFSHRSALLRPMKCIWKASRTALTAPTCIITMECFWWIRVSWG